MKNLVKQELCAGGFKFYYTTELSGNTRFCDEKKYAIIQAILCSYTEGVYQTDTGRIKRQLLNGSAQYLTRSNKTGEYYFS